MRCHRLPAKIKRAEMGGEDVTKGTKILCSITPKIEEHDPICRVSFKQSEASAHE